MLFGFEPLCSKPSAIFFSVKLKFFIVGGFAQSSKFVTRAGSARNGAEKVCQMLSFVDFQFTTYETIYLFVNLQFAGLYKASVHNLPCPA